MFIKTKLIKKKDRLRENQSEDLKRFNQLKQQLAEIKNQKDQLNRQQQNEDHNKSTQLRSQLAEIKRQKSEIEQERRELTDENYKLRAELSNQNQLFFLIN